MTKLVLWNITLWKRGSLVVHIILKPFGCLILSVKFKHILPLNYKWLKWQFSWIKKLVGVLNKDKNVLVNACEIFYLALFYTCKIFYLVFFSSSLLLRLFIILNLGKEINDFRKKNCSWCFLLHLVEKQKFLPPLPRQQCRVAWQAPAR